MFAALVNNLLAAWQRTPCTCVQPCNK